jgi:MinD-like ATPase involved in chromosome partitioning or flagellar assembly
MSRIVSVLSFRRGTGKSNITASLAGLLAGEGRRVGVVDGDIQSPGIHVLFGLGEEDLRWTLNDFLRGRCPIEEAAYDLTERLDSGLPGRLFFTPASTRYEEMSRASREAFDTDLMLEGLRDLTTALSLDVLLIDTHAGLHRATLLPIALSDALAIVLRPDQQDYQGTGVIVDLARQLESPRLMLIVNEVPNAFDFEDLRGRLAETYDCEVATLPYSESWMALASAEILALRYPDHPVAHLLRRVAGSLLA